MLLFLIVIIAIVVVVVVDAIFVFFLALIVLMWMAAAVSMSEAKSQGGRERSGEPTHEGCHQQKVTIFILIVTFLFFVWQQPTQGDIF